MLVTRGLLVRFRKGGTRPISKQMRLLGLGQVTDTDESEQERRARVDETSTPCATCI
jgi:hypothetical protein